MSVSLTITITCDDCGAITTRPNVGSARDGRRAVAAAGWFSQIAVGGTQDHCPRCVGRRMNTSRSISPRARQARAAGAATRRGAEL